MNLLVVDAHEIDRSVVTDLLEADCNCVAVDSVEKAHDWLAQQQPDCILLGDMIPGTDVFAALERWAEQKLAVVILTGDDNTANAQRALHSGAADFLPKGQLNRESLLRTVRNAAEKNELVGRLAALSQDQQDFIAAASHDIRGPLRRIGQFIDRIEKRAGPEEGSKDSGDFGFIRDSLADLDRLLTALRAYARIEQRKQVFEPVDLNAVIARIQVDWAQEIDRTGAELTVDNLPTVYGNPASLEQLLKNLLRNAFTYSGGSAPVVRINAEALDSGWKLSVTDRGIGMDPKHHGRIFQPFTRLHAPQEYAGAGLGLASCKKIIERHKGRIWVDSELGRGTTFHFTLPTADLPVDAASSEKLAPPAPALGPGLPPKPQPTPSWHVLLAEDDRSSSMVVAAHLRGQGHSVVEVDAGDKVIRALERGRFDALLLDVELPVLKGMEIAAHIRQQEKRTGGYLPILGTTGHPPEEFDRLINNGMDAVLEKPLVGAAVVKALADITQKKKTAAARPPTSTSP